MGVFDTKIFKSGNSVAVRLPKELGFREGAQVRIVREGDGVTIRPRLVEDPEEARRQLQKLLDDLDAIGRPGVVQDREAIRAEFPARPGL